MLSGRTYLGVGTAIYPPEDDGDLPYGADQTVSARDGRFLLVEPRSKSGPDGEAVWSCDILESLTTVGPVHDLEVIHGFLAVAASSKVSTHTFQRPIRVNILAQVTVYRLEQAPPNPLYRQDTNPSHLVQISSWASTFIAQHLRLTPKSKLHPEDRLVVGDGMRSISVLEVNEESGAIFSYDKDMATHSVMGLERIRDRGESVVIADV